ncbi:MAG: hypothetical protein HY817_03820 [Candidatus Abawacabacteria bacterium]|nr:hypothetical protein [Candidatus Abawacabacteria bacterium]
MILYYGGVESKIATKSVPYRSGNGVESLASNLTKLVLRFRRLLKEAGCENWSVTCSGKKRVGMPNTYTLTRSFRAQVGDLPNEFSKLSVHYSVGSDKLMGIMGVGNFTPELSTDIHFICNKTEIGECWIQAITSRLIGVDTGITRAVDSGFPLPAADLLSLASAVLQNCNYGPVRSAQRATFSSGDFLHEVTCNRIHATGEEQIPTHRDTMRVLMESLRD